jgi:hypothetical protein
MHQSTSECKRVKFKTSRQMETFTMTRFLGCALLIALIVPIHHAKPTTQEPAGRAVATPEAQEMVLVPVGTIAEKKDDGEDMETANTMVFRPLFAYRRIQSQRRRLYNQRRYDRFPTLA